MIVEARSRVTISVRIISGEKNQMHSYQQCPADLGFEQRADSSCLIKAISESKLSTSPHFIKHALILISVPFRYFCCCEFWNSNTRCHHIKWFAKSNLYLLFVCIPIHNPLLSWVLKTVIAQMSFPIQAISGSQAQAVYQRNNTITLITALLVLL